MITASAVASLAGLATPKFLTIVLLYAVIAKSIWTTWHDPRSVDSLLEDFADRHFIDLLFTFMQELEGLGYS